MAQHKIRFVDDDKMPDEHAWVLCGEHEDGATLYLRRTVRLLPDDEWCLVMEAAWKGFRELMRDNSERDYSATG